MPAIPPHSTATTEAAWDGPAMKANLKTNQDLAYYRQAFAWREAGADLTLKTSYKFIHHAVSASGSIGAANVRACQSAVGVLNGGRGGTTIPDADRKGVWNHLAKHIRDAGLEPAELKSLAPVAAGAELRTLPGTLEIRQEGDKRVLVGLAAPFNKRSQDLGWFTEQIQPGAFADALRISDAAGLFNHNPDNLLGRQSAGTLRLSETDAGLRYEIDLPDTQIAAQVREGVLRGDIQGNSFAFTVAQEGGDLWQQESDGAWLRTIVKVDQLYDVGPVVYPAYRDTSVSLRAIEQLRAEEPEEEPEVPELPEVHPERDPRAVELHLTERTLDDWP